MKQPKVEAFYKVTGTAIVPSENGGGMVVHYSAFLEDNDEYVKAKRPMLVSIERWHEIVDRVNRECLFNARERIRASIRGDDRADQMEAELAGDPTAEPPLVEMGRLDLAYLPPRHPDKLQDALARISTDLGCTVGEAYKVLKQEELLWLKQEELL